jgi:hypothetical protein
VSQPNRSYGECCGAYSLGEENLRLRPVYEYIRFLYGELGGEYIHGPCIEKYSLALERSAFLKVGLECEYLGTF